MLLEQFKVLFDRPEKVKKLRELILQLAVRGNLVPQDENDEPASVLLEKIREEKERLVREGKIKKEKPLPEIKEEEKPYELPKGWEWVRLGETIQFVNGYAFKSNTYVDISKNQVIRLGNVKNDKLILDDKGIFIPDDIANNCENYLIRENDILATMTGTRGKRDYFFTCLVDKEDLVEQKLYLNQRVGLIRTYLKEVSGYYINALKADFILDKIFESETGTANQGNIGVKAINELLMPLPPLNEQKRIVEKVEFLKAFCDKLEKELERKIKYSSLSSKSVFNSIGNCSSAQELEETLRFIIENFRDLTLGDGAVKELKNAILQLAVQGKLVPQDPKDEPASVLLERIKEEKEKLIKEGKIKREKPLPEIKEEEKPYELPKRWQFVRMSSLADFITDGTHQTPKYTDSGMMFLSAQNIKPFKFMPFNYKFVSDEDYIKYVKNVKPEFGDILLTRVGSNIGEAAVIDQRLDFAIYVSLCLIKTNQSYVDSRYLCLWLNSPDGTNKSISNILGRGTSQGNLNLSLIRNFVIPLPPLKEQNRIVEKVNSLMSLCDELEKRIEKSKKYSEKLMEAVLKEAIKA